MPGSWSYDPSDVGTNPIDACRLLVGDTDSQAWLLANEEISWALAQERNLWSAAARCAEMIGMLFTRRVDVKLGRVMQIAYSKTAAQYFETAKWLRKKSMGTVVPYIGGAYINDIQNLANNPTLLEPFFTRNQMTNPWAGGYSPDSTPPVGGGQGVFVDEEIGE